MRELGTRDGDFRMALHIGQEEMIAQSRLSSSPLCLLFPYTCMPRKVLPVTVSWSTASSYLALSLRSGLSEPQDAWSLSL